MIPVVLEKDGVHENFRSIRSAWMQCLCPGADKIGGNRKKVNAAIEKRERIKGYLITKCEST